MPDRPSLAQLKRRTFLAGLTATAGGALLAACGGDPAPDTPRSTAAGVPTGGGMPAGPAASPQEVPRPGGTLALADSIDITTADPQASNEIPILYAYAEGLTSLGDAGELKPFLASSWEAGSDAKVYTFRLRADVPFHSGRPLTSADVR